MTSDRTEAPGAWASWLNVIMGIWLIISPWVVGFAGQTAAFWNSFLAGIAVLLVALIAGRSFKSSPSWWNVALAVWLIVSPWVVGFSSQEAATANSVVPGIIVGILALTAALAKSAPGRRSPV
jgi:uncharacterized membrane protein HdeD (DUF308 family)